LRKVLSLEIPTPDRGGLAEILAYFDAQNEVDRVCTAIGARVRSGIEPTAAIQAEMDARFADADRLDRIGRYASALMLALIAEFRNRRWR